MAEGAVMAAISPSSVAALALVVLAAPAPGFDRTEKHPEHGFSLDRSSKFEARPIPPEAVGLLLLYAPKDAPADRRAPVTHAVYEVEVGSDAERDLERWVLGTFQPVELERERSVRQRYGRRPARFVGGFYDGDGILRSLFIHGWIGEDDAFVFVGECEPDRLRRERRTFERVAKSFRFFSAAEVSAERARWERHYARSSLKHREERIEVASELVDGWSIKDTEHSMILYNGASDSPVLAQFARNLVAIRRRLAEDYPPDRPIDALSVVRICGNRGEYLTYGGSPSTAGYFNAQTQELVLYDARTDRSEPMPDDHPTMRTLYHEACHQFFFHTASALSPHSWFDEGTAEYYAGAVLEAGRVTGIAPLDARGRHLASPTVLERLPPLGLLMEMSQDQFYADADVNYSMAYGFARFLRTSRAARSRRAWQELPERYFLTLRTTWRREAEQLALSGITAQRYGEAIDRSRAKALEAALERVDLAELESAFLRWIRSGGS